MTRPQVSVIVLAGGRSRRFGRDKLREAFDGRTLLEHAIDAVAPVADETIVVAAPDEHRKVPDGIVLVHDATSFEGPLAGILTGLGHAKHPVTLVVGGDMPKMVPAVLEVLIEGLLDPAADAAVLEDGGERRPLPMVLRTVPAKSASGRLIAAGERRLGALMDALATVAIDEPAWRLLDPDGRTLVDIDTPSDLP